MPSSLVAIDPGACAGVAAFFDRVLVSVGLEDVSRLPVRCVYAPGVVDVVIVERPEVYSKGPRQADPNDLIKLALRAGALAQAFAPREVIEVLPKTWKGQVPKEIMAKRILASLSLEERETWLFECGAMSATLRHNAIDAIGIGLYHLGRLN